MGALDKRFRKRLKRALRATALERRGVQAASEGKHDAARQMLLRAFKLAKAAVR